MTPEAPVSTDTDALVERLRFFFATHPMIMEAAALIESLQARLVEAERDASRTEKFNDTLNAEVDSLHAVLRRIAAYGKDGICPYGCDTPDIANNALPMSHRQFFDAAIDLAIEGSGKL